MRILSIGNSFSQDAQRYLHGFSKAVDKKIDCVNLYIGGCPLERHYRNMLSGAKAYSLEFNGESTGFSVSLEEALLAGHYDVITLQQASVYSGKLETYLPYITEIASYVRRYSPAAKLFIHQTWAYEDGSDSLESAVGSRHIEDMLSPIVDTYRRAAEKISADGLIPSGELLYQLHIRGIENVYRDSRHVSLGVSRYALAALWTRALTGADIRDCGFAELDEPLTDAEKQIVFDAVEYLCP